MSANSRHRRSGPRSSNTVDGNIADIWAALSAVEHRVDAAPRTFAAPLEIEVHAGEDGTRMVVLRNTETGGVLAEWGPA